MKKINLIIAFIVAFSGFSQSSNNTNSFGSGFRLDIESQQGHAFLVNDWYTGNLVKNDGSVTEKKLLNYHLVDNVLVSMNMVNGEKSFQKLNSNDYTGFVMTDDKSNVHIYSKVDGKQFDNIKDETKFYLMVSAPTKNVILETTKSFKDPNASGWASTTTTTKRGSYKERTQAYVLNNSGKYEKVKLSNNGILRVFKDKKKELKEYISKNNINIKEPTDLIQTVAYYHSL